MDDFGSKLIWVIQKKNENVFEVEDIFTNILLRLPVKSLLVCKSVCKHWRNVISSSSFMHLHLIQSQQNPSFVFYDPRLRKRNTMLLRFKSDGETTESFPGCDSSYHRNMVCSFNGLIFCTNYDGPMIFKPRYESDFFDIYICNPATRQVLLLPPTPRSKYGCHSIGVSSGRTIDEYKVFQFHSTVSSYEGKVYFTEEIPYECMVYSSITGSWKSIGTVAHIPLTSSNYVCINGIAYWLSKSRIDRKEVYHILAVDTEENFSVIWIPKEKARRFLVNLEGCLCLVFQYIHNDPHRFDIWALEDSNESVWVKKWSGYIPRRFHAIYDISYVTVRKNEILFGSTKTDYFFYNMETRTWRTFDWKHCWKEREDLFFFRPIAYTESLLPCNGRYFPL